MDLRFARSAEADLEKLADWIARDNPTRAVSFVAELRAACVKIQEFPEAWPLVPRYAAKGIRRKVHGNYLIFYVIDPSYVTIVHILHGARDFDDALI